jgi:hypothetical protein
MSTKAARQAGQTMPDDALLTALATVRSAA